MLHFSLGSKARETPGSDLNIDCLWCGKQNTSARSRQRVEWLTLFHLVPILRLTTVLVRCDSCHKDMIAKCSLEELNQSNPLTLKHLFVKHVSLVGKTCIVLGWLLCWAVYIGLIPAIIGFIYGRKYGGRMKKFAFWGLILNIFSLPIFILLVMLIQFLTK
jgi:hypothetical protein